jgi:hypothetical protein
MLVSREGGGGGDIDCKSDQSLLFHYIYMLHTIYKLTTIAYKMIKNKIITTFSFLF